MRLGKFLVIASNKITDLLCCSRRRRPRYALPLSGSLNSPLQPRANKSQGVGFRYVLVPESEAADLTST